MGPCKQPLGYDSISWYFHIFHNAIESKHISVLIYTSYSLSKVVLPPSSTDMESVRSTEGMLKQQPCAMFTTSGPNSWLLPPGVPFPTTPAQRHPWQPDAQYNMAEPAVLSELSWRGDSRALSSSCSQSLCSPSVYFQMKPADLSPSHDDVSSQDSSLENEVRVEYGLCEITASWITVIHTPGN